MLWFQAVMFEAFSFMQDVDLAMAWLARYRATVQSINGSSADVRLGGARHRMRIRAIG
jgi:hypothetical protein